MIKLPQVFAQDDLPAALDETANSENSQKWEYLHKIIPKIKTFDDQNTQLFKGLGATAVDSK